MTLILLVTGCVSPSKFYVMTAILTMIKITWVENISICQRRWRLAHAFCFVDLLAFIFEEDPIAELPGGRGYVSRTP